ncbi:interferon-inducible GTPase-domain-containing protein [Pisolithus orientalis]|uniref:interferon-inducible GTPase-domain-containing protein n=1 Tax=Pisolithus orientalis TaxID=936130 RepID=UPI002225A4AF|nr:interferon-inducible GTPase-domain-containing protein [Pisolithus orientalis]KAI6030625.1 interferon-inducible GTPase-domain-containing protein [Pisolithus orientalis]
MASCPGMWFGEGFAVPSPSNVLSGKSTTDRLDLRHMGNVQSVTAGLVATARAVMAMIHLITHSPIRDNPTLRNINNARNGWDARRQAAAALHQAEEARRRAEEAILQLQQVRRQVPGGDSYDPLSQDATSASHSSRQGWEQRCLIDLDSASDTTLTEAGEEARSFEERSLGDIEKRRGKEQELLKIWRNACQETAAEKARIAKEAQEEMEANLRKGVQPITIPTPEEVAAAKSKESLAAENHPLINAFRGLRNKDVGAAPTGIVEMTSTVDRYPDPNPRNPFVWYDIPGAGTLQQSDWLYFNSQGLFVFDCIIVLFDVRFTTTDIAILKNCQRFQIPTYIVRSKADAHIRNIMRDLGYESGSDGRARRAELYSAAREQYIKETRVTVQRNLQEADLPDQKVYIVCNTTVLSTVKDRSLSPKTIDELDLMKDLLEEARSRRCVPQRILQ